MSGSRPPPPPRPPGLSQLGVVGPTLGDAGRPKNGVRPHPFRRIRHPWATAPLENAMARCDRGNRRLRRQRQRGNEDSVGAASPHRKLPPKSQRGGRGARSKGDFERVQEENRRVRVTENGSRRIYTAGIPEGVAQVGNGVCLQRDLAHRPDANSQARCATTSLV
jgi:hypothetical protein